MTNVLRWDFEPDAGPAHLLAELTARGIAWSRERGVINDTEIPATLAAMRGSRRP